VPTWNPERRRRFRDLTLATLLALPPALSAEGRATLDIEQFTLRITDETGTISHVLRGDRLQQFDPLGYQRTENPRLELRVDGSVDWIWTAPLALHYPVEHRLELLGLTEGLRLARPGRSRSRIETSDVTIHTDTQRVSTEARATRVEPGLFMTGIGMHADLPADTIELHRDVRTVYSSHGEQE
jgi:lipopolysaccharide export system protein LptC